MMKRCPVVARVGALGVLMALAGSAAAQQVYPSKPVRLVLPFAPGGGTDITGRLLARKLSDLWDVPVVVDNRPGAGSTVGTAIAAKAAPDGYTMGVTSMSHAINATLYRTLPYDTIKDFEPIILTVRVPNVLVVHPGVPAKSVKDLVALAKSQPGRLRFSSSGVGGVSHLAAEVFRAAAGIELLHVPYRGAGPAMTALVGSEAQLMMATMPVLLPQMKANRVRPLAISSLTRSPLVPALPTIAESGYPGFQTDSWYGLLAPAGTPPDIVRQVNADATRALDSADLKAALAQQGAQPAGGTPEEFLRFIQAEIVKWRKAITAAKVPLAN
ncbi:MAG: tripartite tricarboxylate transporter substrate binding protein [Betaproteobacteria bacterium]|nr:tripartite tricarboxylate transporter substrate binding protein [Betaproteobacteria bacterium]